MKEYAKENYFEMGIKFISDYVHDKLIKFARQKALRNEWNRQKFKENKVKI